MANYNVDIAIALKNSNKLVKLRKELKGATDNIREFNKEASKQNKVAVSTFGKLNKQISRARSLLDKAAIGTSSFTRAARAAVAVEKEMNLQLRQKEKLLAKIRAESITSGQQAVIDRTARARQVKSGFAGFSARADQVTASAKVEAIKNKARDRHLKNIDKKVAKIATIQTQQQTSRAFGGLSRGFGVPGGQIGARLPRGFRLRQQFQEDGLFGMPGGMRGRIKGGAGSAMIGGGFPLLFGAGGLSSVMGGIAGGLGGALAPGGGFAASIAATAAAAQIEKVRAFRKAVNDLNKDIKAMGAGSEFTRQQIKQLAKDFDIANEEAIKLAATVKEFGAQTGMSILSAFGSKEVFESLAGLRDTDSVLNKILDASNNISVAKKNELFQILATEGSLSAQLALEKEILAVRRRAFIDEKVQKVGGLPTDKRGNIVARLRGSKTRQEEFLRKQREGFGQDFNKQNQDALQALDTAIKTNEQLQFIAEFRAPSDEIRELLNPMRSVLDLSTAIKDGFEESFKGIVKGTMSVSDAFRSMLNRIADSFLDTAARLLSAQIQKSFLGLFGNLFSFGTPTFNNPAPMNPGFMNTGIPEVLPKGSFGISTIKRQYGGGVTAGKSYLVGERGAELFTPGATGTITPNHAMGGTNIVVNVDASGSSVEGDEEQGRELGRLISVAIQSELIKEKRPGGLLA